MRQVRRSHPGPTTTPSGRSSLALPFRPAATALARLLSPQAVQRRARRHQTGIERVDAVARQRIRRWFALVAITWRSLALLIALVGSKGWLHTAPQLLIAACAVIAGNIALFARIAQARPLQLLNTRGFFAADVATVAVLNLWASATIPHQSLYLPYHDLFFPYAWGTVALWTGLRSPLTGTVLLLGGQVPLQLGMARINGFRLDTVNWGAVADRDLWLLTSFVIAAIVAWLAREAAWASASEGVRAGREAERAQTLRALHDTVLQTLEALALRAATADRPAEERLREVRAVALQQAHELRAALRQADERAPSGLAAGLGALVQEFRARELQVELVTAELAADPPVPVTEALLGAAREALTNVRKHAAVSRAVVRAAGTAEAVEVLIRDQGRGFDTGLARAGYGLAHSVIDRMREAGGDAAVWSAPARGTRVRLWWHVG